MSARDTAPFERLARMIERELELIGAGRIEEFDRAVIARGEYLRTLPTPAPAAARSAVVRAQAIHSRVEIEALRVRESLAQSRNTARRSRRIRRSYAGPVGRRFSTSV